MRFCVWLEYVETDLGVSQSTISSYIVSEEHYLIQFNFHMLHRGGSNTNNSNANDFAGHLSFRQSSNILQAYLFYIKYI